MPPFRDFPIRRKLTFFIMLVSCLALVLAILAVLGYELFTFKQRSVRDLAALADMIRISTQPLLDFSAPADAQEILNVLSSDPEIVAACIYDKQRQVFASYVRPHERDFTFPPPQPDGHSFTDGDLILFRKITSKGEKIGTVYLRCDLALAYSRVPHYLVILGIVVLALFGLSFILSTALHRVISAPMLRLAHTARLITERKDYSVRAVKESEDELGQLTEAFNQMLGAIAVREKALNEAKDELENRVRQRTASLQESIQSLEGVLYHVAHDLRAPLRAMQGFTTILLNQYAPNLDAAGKDYAQRVSIAAVRMDDLIQDLLEYGRLTHAEMALQFTDLEPALATVQRHLAEPIAASRAELVVDRPLPQVWANPKALEQVLTHLLRNAMTFVAPGVTPKIHLSAEISEAKVRLWLQDNGIGIEPEHQARIFRVFERLHSADKYPGTGIGLAIVRKAMERMGGQVGLESQPQAGSRFWLDFPTPPRKT